MGQDQFPYNLRASDGSFYPIFHKRFGYLLVTKSSYESGFSWSAAINMVEYVPELSTKSPNLKSFYLITYIAHLWYT